MTYVEVSFIRWRGRVVRINRRQIRMILLSYVAVMAMLQLWPYNFERWICTNGASWARDGHGMVFAEGGVLRSVSPPVTLCDRIVASDALSVEAWITTTTLDQSGPARIMSNSRDP